MIHLKSLIAAIIALLFTVAVPGLTQAQSSSLTVRRGREIAVRLPKARAAKRQALAEITTITRSNRAKIVARLNGEILILSTPSSKNGPRITTAGAGVLSICQEIRSRTSATCEPNRVVTIMNSPSDPLFDSQWHHRKISSPSAWDSTVGSANVVVAVIDTGVDYTHPDLVDRIAYNTAEIADNGIDDDGNGFVDDYRGYDFSGGAPDPLDDNLHGTHVSGIIGGTGNNGVGITGVSWQVAILPVKVLDSDGSGTIADVAAGIEYAVTRGASIINLSIGGSDSSDLLEESVRQARDAGVLLIAAAGNESTNNDEVPSYPANVDQPNVISVGASTEGETLAYFSNFGQRTVHLVAPGTDILSTVPEATTGSLYTRLDGTSMATPVVVGVAALMKTINPSLNALDIKRGLLASVDKYNSYLRKTVTGGRVNAARAVQYALTTVAGTVADPLATATTLRIKSIRSRTRERRISLSGTISDAGGALANERVWLRCNKRYSGVTISDGEGRFQFSVKRGRTSAGCRAENFSSRQSNQVVVPKV